MPEIVTFNTGRLHAKTSDPFWSGAYLSAYLAWVLLLVGKVQASVASGVIEKCKPAHLDKVVTKGVEPVTKMVME